MATRSILKTVSSVALYREHALAQSMKDNVDVVIGLLEVISYLLHVYVITDYRIFKNYYFCIQLKSNPTSKLFLFFPSKTQPLEPNWLLNDFVDTYTRAVQVPGYL